MGQALGDGEGQGSLICCSSWGHKELDMTKWPNNKESKTRPPVCIWNETEEAEVIQTWRTVQAKSKKKNFNSKEHEILNLPKQSFKGYSVSIESGVPSSCGPGFLVKTQRRILSLTIARKFLEDKEREDRENTSTKKWASLEETTGQLQYNFKGKFICIIQEVID